MRLALGAAIGLAGLAVGVGGALYGVRDHTVTSIVTSTRVVTTARTTTVTSYVSPLPGGGPTCSVYDAGSGERVVVRGVSPGTLCGVIARKWSNGMSFWSLAGQPAYSSTLVCAMQYEQSEIDVYDTGGQIGGNETCGMLQSRGWAQVG